MAQYQEIMALAVNGASYSTITAALNCSRRDISRVKAIIKEHNINAERLKELTPGWFDTIFSDGRSNRSQAFDQPDFKKLADRLKNNDKLT